MRFVHKENCVLTLNTLQVFHLFTPVCANMFPLLFALATVVTCVLIELGQ